MSCARALLSRAIGGRSPKIPRSSNLSRRRYASEVDVHNFQKPSSFGQPLFLSHPNLVKEDEVTPGITLEEFKLRRTRLMDRLPESSMVVSCAAPVKYMSGEIFYKYRQASDFWYLTGFQEPESAVILQNTSSGIRTTLFCRGKDPARELWEGSRTSFETAASVFGADEVLPTERLPDILKTLSSQYDNIYTDGGKKTRQQRSLLRMFSSPTSAGRGDSDMVADILPSAKRRALAPEVGRLRMIKSEAEQRLMGQAAQISGRAHAKTMRFTEPGKPEYALAAHFEYMCALNGAQRPAYVPVVASGPNALIIHYVSNDQIVRDGEMVLIDAGCEYNGYASDITRTYPANGTFTAPQRDLYAAVLSAQKQLITHCTASSGLSLDALHRMSCTFLKRELNQLGFALQTGDLEGILYPHYLSHPIGIDLHESKFHNRSEALQAGMVITVEPGIYVPTTKRFPTHFHNIGIRIEDDILVQQDNSVVLSVSAPKEIADVEGACQGSIGLEPY